MYDIDFQPLVDAAWWLMISKAAEPYFLSIYISIVIISVGYFIVKCIHWVEKD